MATQTVLKTAVTAHHAGSGVEDLIRSLVHTVETEGETCAPIAAGTESEEILLDIDVDGVRYILVRLPAADPPKVQLSPREQEIARMVAQGHPNKVIAEVLSISTWTVCTHLRRIFAKAGVGSRAAMVARLLENRSGISDNAHPPHSSANHNHAAKHS